MPETTFVNKPVLVNIREENFTVDVRAAEEELTSRTKAIIDVHLYGHLATMTEMLALAKRHNLKVIEDCVQATGAEVAVKNVGALCDIGCFSFYPTNFFWCCRRWGRGGHK